MSNTHKIYLISDSTGETLERIFMALRAQFEKFEHDLFHFSFIVTPRPSLYPFHSVFTASTISSMLFAETNDLM